jgi:hypothetical protein
LLIIDFGRPNQQVFDEYDNYTDVEYTSQWSNQNQRTVTPNEFEHERRPSPFYNTAAAAPTRAHIQQHSTDFHQPHGVYSREPMRQPVIPQHTRVVSPLHAGHPAPIAHHPILVRDQYYRPQFQAQQFPEYTNGYQPPFAGAPFVAHPGMQHLNQNVRRHEDSLRNLRSPLLEDFRSAKNKKFELKVNLLSTKLTI